MWDRTQVNLGLVRSGRKYTMVHKFVGETIDIRSVALSCSCTGYKLDRINQTVTIEFMPGKVPQQLIRQGKNNYSVRKNTIVVSVVNGKERIDTFTFVATVKDKL